MDLIRHLRCFVAVAEEGHFGRAAERLGMAQPPLSQRIQRLERELGVRLFERSSRRVTITRGGTLLLDEARELLARSETLLTTARRIHDGESGLLRAALPPDLAGGTVAALLDGFQERRAGMEVELHELATAEQLAQLAAHEVDIGVVHHPCDVAGLELGPVLRHELGVLLPGDAEAARAETVALADLAGYELVLFPRREAPAVHDDLLTTCARHGFTPAAVRQGRGPDFVRGLLLSYRAVGFAPRATRQTLGEGPLAGGEGAELVWRPLVDAPLAWRHSAAWPKGRGDAAVRAFAETVTEILGRTALGPDLPTGPLHLRPAAEYWL